MHDVNDFSPGHTKCALSLCRVPAILSTQNSRWLATLFAHSLFLSIFAQYWLFIFMVQQLGSLLIFECIHNNFSKLQNDKQINVNMCNTLWPSFSACTHRMLRTLFTFYHFARHIFLKAFRLIFMLLALPLPFIFLWVSLFQRPSSTNCNIY